MRCQRIAVALSALLLALLLPTAPAAARDQVKVQGREHTDTVTRWQAKGTTFIQERCDYQVAGKATSGSVRYAFKEGTGKHAVSIRWPGQREKNTAGR